MGIKNLKKFLRENYNEVIQTTNIKRFSDEKIGVDISSYFYKYKTIFGDKWLNAFPSLIYCLKKFRVHGVFIFDGKAPIEKEITKEKRRGLKTNAEENVMNLSVDLDIFKETGKSSELLQNTMNRITENDKNNYKINSLLHENKKNNINIQIIEEYIEKKEKQIVDISKEDINDIKTMLTLFGVSFIQADGEAEALAAYLCSKDILKAVLTEDTDVLTYGTNLFISNLNTKNGDCEIIKLKNVLDSLELKFEEFRDLCIMCGTDYNSNIPNYGSAKVYKFIKKYKSIEKFIEGEGSKLDYKILKHESSRKLFSTFGNVVDKKYKSDYWNNNIDFDKLYDFLELKKCKISRDIIQEYWKENDDLIFEEEDLQISRIEKIIEENEKEEVENENKQEDSKNKKINLEKDEIYITFDDTEEETKDNKFVDEFNNLVTELKKD